MSWPVSDCMLCSCDVPFACSQSVLQNLSAMQRLQAQLEQLRSEIGAHLARLDAQKVTLLEEKLSMQGRVQAVLDGHLKAAQAPLEAQR